MTDKKEKMIDEEMLGRINGGTDTTIPTKKSFCPKCDRETTFNLYTGGRAICQECGHQKFM